MTKSRNLVTLLLILFWIVGNSVSVANADSQSGCVDAKGLNSIDEVIAVNHEMRRLIQHVTQSNVKSTAKKMAQCKKQGDRAANAMRTDKHVPSKSTPAGRRQLKKYLERLGAEYAGVKHDFQTLYAKNKPLAKALADAMNASGFRATPKKKSHVKQPTKHEKLAMELYDASRQGILQYVENVVAKDPALLKSKREVTIAMNSAAQNGQKEIIEYFLKHGADINNEADGYSPLLVTVNHGYLYLIDYLLDKGAKVTPEIMEAAKFHLKKEKAYLDKLQAHYK